MYADLRMVLFAIGLIIAGVGCFGYIFYFVVFLIRRSNDYGSDNEITDFSSKGFSDLFFDANVDPTLTMQIPSWMEQDEEDKKIAEGAWRCKNCQKLNQKFIYVCSCGNSKKNNDELSDNDMDGRGREADER